MPLASSLHRVALAFACLHLALVAGCADSHPVVAPDGGGDAPDAGPLADAANPDGGDAETDAAPPPACVEDDDCDDGDDCTTDTCGADGGACTHDNPLADCGRFDGIECAGDLATSLLTIERSFCIPGFAIDVPLGDLDAGADSIHVSLCEGQKCDPADEEDGCLVTFVSEGDPATSPDPGTLHLSGRVVDVDGSVAFTGVVPAIGGGGLVPLSCDVTVEVGSGLPIAADLALTEVMACGTDREVDASVDFDLSSLRIRIVGQTPSDLIRCGLVNLNAASQLATFLQTAEPQLEDALAQALSALDCGTCGEGCPADLVCTLPEPPAGP